MIDRPVFIGIAGGTGSGKTTIARRIFETVGPQRIEWISHDSYYKDFSTLPLSERHRVNFDHPESLETSLLAAHLDELRNRHEVEIPIYDFSFHVRAQETRKVGPKGAIIVEGILVLAEPEIRKRIDIRLFVDTPADIRFLRRLRRDIESRGRTVESVIEQYLSTVRPMHEEFVEPSKRYADLIIPEGGENQVALDAIISRVEQLLSYQ
jgi:uridine kinase